MATEWQGLVIGETFTEEDISEMQYRSGQEMDLDKSNKLTNLKVDSLTILAMISSIAGKCEGGPSVGSGKRIGDRATTQSTDCDLPSFVTGTSGMDPNIVICSIIKCHLYVFSARLWIKRQEK